MEKINKTILDALNTLGSLDHYSVRHGMVFVYFYDNYHNKAGNNASIILRIEGDDDDDWCHVQHANVVPSTHWKERLEAMERAAQFFRATGIKYDNYPRR